MSENKDLEVIEEASPMDLAVTQMTEIAAAVVENIVDDRDKADELYDFMCSEIDINGDKNPATREAMTSALNAKMKGSDQMIELLKVKAKLINPNKGLNVNISLGKFTDNKGGNTSSMINIVEEIQYEIDNEESDE